MTLYSPPSVTLANFTSSTSPEPNGMPAGVQFDEGFFSFEINSLTPGGSAEVIMTLPEGFIPNTYYMYGPTPDNATPHWYEFKFNGRTGAEFFGNNYVALHFIDGERGDADLTANGSITDPGAPGIESVTASSSSGGGCTLLKSGQGTMRLDYLLMAIVLAAARHRNKSRTRLRTV